MMDKKLNILAVITGIVIALALFIPLVLKGLFSMSLSEKENVCEGEFRGAEARNLALEKGYVFNQRSNCIDKESYAQINREAEAHEARRAAKTAQTATREASELASENGKILAEARQGFQTRIAFLSPLPKPLPQPPAHLFKHITYTSKQDLALSAYVTPDPRDGQKHPAIIWLTGGDTNSLDDFWTPGPESNDQSASAFREAGIVMMFPTLRGGNDNPGNKEFFYSEIDDVLAAADHLSRLAYVDANRIYLGGHSTGGTLALLTAEMSARFKAVFAFGPTDEVDQYPPSLIPINFSAHAPLELKLRSPIHWLHGIASPTYLIEGKNPPGNMGALEKMCQISKNPQLQCIVVEGHNHFSVIAAVSRTIAARMAVEASGTKFVLRQEQFKLPP